jgi:hypothetical protein
MSRYNYPTTVDQAMVRSNALLTIVVTLAGLVSGAWWVMALLAIDFAVRGVFNPRWSPLSLASAVLVPWLPLERKPIYFPPKQFAARVGLVFSASAAVLLWMEFVWAAGIVMATLMVFAGLECFLNICMGCIVYNALVGLRRRLGGS